MSKKPLNELQVPSNSGTTGYMLASTWIQCAPHEGIGGPFMTPGGQAKNPDINDNVKEPQSDAGILWWLQWVKNTYGPWNPPATTNFP
ncbi:MAG: hypothetical protein WBC05_23845 [Sedimentisphaerales bacterium]